MLGIGATPGAQGTLLAGALRQLANTGKYPRILLSGSADYSLLAHVLRAYAAEGVNVEPVVVDLCRTPLYLCEWYGKQLSKNINTVVSNILDFESPEPFDLICTHAFLGYFTPDLRKQLLHKWYSLLRPGGRVIAVQRIRPGTSQEVVRFTTEEKAAFRKKVETEALARQDSLDIETSQLVSAAETYAEQFRTYPIKSRDELMALFTDAGFRFERLEFGPAETAHQTAISGPTIPGTAEYAFVEAIHP
jgi:SAM-dependent methyltransferase